MEHVVHVFAIIGFAVSYLGALAGTAILGGKLHERWVHRRGRVCGWSFCKRSACSEAWSAAWRKRWGFDEGGN